MQVNELGLGEVREILPKRFGDDRGYFSETWNRESYISAGIDEDWIQDNHSFSSEKFILRGLHFQMPPFGQAKLVRVTSGVVFDVAVDIREGSDNFGKWVGVELDAQKGNQLYIPSGFAHGFVTLTEEVHFLYKVTNPYAPEHDRSIRWDDPGISIDWPIGNSQPQLSNKDAAAKNLSETPTGFRL